MRSRIVVWPSLVAMLALTGCGSGSSTCTTCTVSGRVSGLSANESVTLLNNGGNALVVSGNGGFTFPSSQANGGAYDVTVKSHTPGITCPVSNASGTVGSSNVTNVAVSCASGTESVLYSFAGGPTDGMRPAAGLIIDSAGNLYGTTSAGGPNTSTGGPNGDGTVFTVSASGAERVLYSFAGSPTDGQRPEAGLLMDSSGNLYGTTETGGASGDGTVFKVTPTGTESVLYSFGAVPDGSAPFAGLILDGAGNLYGTTFVGGATNNGTIFKISPTGTETVLYSFKGGTSDGSGPRAGLIMDSAGNLYGTTEFGGMNNEGTVFKLTPTGVETVLYSFKGGASDGASPFTGLIMDSNGDLYGTTFAGGVINAGTVFEISASGTETVLHSFTGRPTDGADPSGGLIADSAGNLYGVTGSGGAYNDGTVFKISATGTETVLYSFKGGATDGSGPVGRLVIDGAGNLYGMTVFGGNCVSLGGCGAVFKIN